MSKKFCKLEIVYTGLSLLGDLNMVQISTNMLTSILKISKKDPDDEGYVLNRLKLRTQFKNIT